MESDAEHMHPYFGDARQYVGLRWDESLEQWVPKYPTVTLNNGTRVIARMHKGRLHAVTYVNETQAERAASKYGIGVYHTPGGRCWYLEFKGAKP